MCSYAVAAQVAASRQHHMLLNINKGEPNKQVVNVNINIKVNRTLHVNVSSQPAKQATSYWRAFAVLRGT